MTQAFYTSDKKNKIIVNVDGGGSNYCFAKNSIHGSNRVYFEITPDGIQQKCFSQKRQCCKLNNATKNFAATTRIMSHADICLLFGEEVADKSTRIKFPRVEKLRETYPALFMNLKTNEQVNDFLKWVDKYVRTLNKLAKDCVLLPERPHYTFETEMEQLEIVKMQWISLILWEKKGLIGQDKEDSHGEV